MKRNLFFIFLCITSYVFGQTTCLLDESVFSGTVAVTSTGISKTKASDATSNHRFGERVAIDGNIAAVASRSNGAAAGKVYIYTNDGSGNWTQQTILTASDGFAGDNFGSAIALEGNYLVVGARSQLDAANVDTGAAYLFEYNGVNTWTQVAIFEPSDGTSGIRFGEAVSIEGDLILVGARNGCTGGCAYMYENDGTNTFTYTETKLEPQVQSNYSGARFGYDVLINNGRAYVGGPQDYSSVGNASAGSVQIWDQANDGTWSRTHRLRGTETSEYFGCSISVEGDYLAIGAYNFEVASTPAADQGRVFVYKVDGNGDYLEANRVMIQNDDKDSYNDQRFGTDVALDGEFLYVGTFGNGSNSTDAVYIFKDDGTNNWTQISKLTSGAGWDEFSNRAVAVSYPTLLIGQNEDDSPSNSGAVYFVSLESTITPTASVTGTTDVYIGQSNGVISVNFDDEATRSQIKFSIDGGATYPYMFNDNSGNADITNLTQGSYELRVAFEDGSCILDLGTVNVNQLPYTAIPDANFEAALEALGYDDISGDGQVPTDYISGVTSLDLNNQNIADLTGINDFAALEVLRIQYNNLTSLDVSNLANLRVLWAANGNAFSSIDVSNNTLLEDFRLRQYTGTSIDLSANTALTRFACDSCDLLTVNTSTNVNLSFLDLWNSDITSLDLTANVNLATLDVFSTNLTTLDVSANTALTNLIANDINTLTSLDVRNGNNVNINTFNVTSNSNLDCVLVDDAAYSTTNWTQIDSGLTFSENYCRYTAIPDANFEAALNTLGYDDIAADGQVPTALIEVVTTLDVSNQSIADLTGIQDFTALTSLDCEDNSLTQLDVSNNTNLQTLIFDNNTISNLNLGTISGLTSIEGRYNQLTTIDLSLHTNLTFINLRDNLFTTVDVTNNPLLETINFRGCTNLTTIDLSNNTNVKSLFFQDTALNGLDVSQNTLLETIIIERVNFNAIDVSNLPALKQLRIGDNSFTELDVSNNPLLERLECENNNLTYLNLKNGNNTIIPNGDFIATGNPSLTCILVDDATWSTTNWTNIDVTASFNDLYCRYTTIPDANFEAELETLGYDDVNGDGQVPTALIEVVTTLDVQNKAISDLTGIEDFTALITLDVDRNNLTQLNLSNNIALETLSANQNDITSIDLSQNVNLQFIDLGANQLTALDVSANTALTRLDCPANDIAALDVSNNISLQILEAFETDIASIDLSANVNLEKLRLYKTDITEIDVTNNPLLNELRIDNTDVSTLDVTNNVQLDWLKVNGSLITSLDLTGLTVLTEFEGQTGILENIDIRNGNNTNMTTFNVTNNSNLACVLVDDAAYSTTNWTQVDSGLTFSETYCRYTAIPDANFEARLNTLGYDDISGDGQVPTALIEVVTELTANGLSIADFTGLEDFASLTSLNVGNNNITSIDLSNLPLLEFLRVDGNPLTSLDISTNTALVDLRCSFVSAMTSIDISNNTLLETAHISNNSIASLDVSNNPLLYWLQINSTPMTTIDLSANSALREFQSTNGVLASLDLSANTALEELILTNNTISTLDLSSNVALRILNVSGTGLTSLNLQNGNNTNIIDYNSLFASSLSCVLVDDESYSNSNWIVKEPGTSFSDTYCRYTTIPDANFEAELEALGYDDISGDGQVPTPLIEGITSLAVPNKGINDLTGIEDFVALTSLNCRLNNLTALDVSQNVLLSTLTADSNSITSIDLSNNTDLEILNLAGSNLSTIDISNNTELRKLFVQGNSALTSIDISNNVQLVEFRTNNTNIAALDLSVHPDLELLECYGSPLSSIDLSNNPQLETLRLENTNITALDLTNNPNIITLRVNDTAIESLDLSNQIGLQSLYAHDTNLSSINVQNGNNTNVTTFIADNNPNLSCILVDDAAYSTTNWTDVDPTVTFRDGMYCRYTAIPDANFEARLEALGYDDISGDGQVPTALIEVVTTLDINSQNIADITGIEDFSALEELSAALNTFTSLDLSNNTAMRILMTKFTPIATLNLSANTQLEQLVCSFNNLSSLDVSANTLLTYLECNNNSIATLDVSNNTALLDLRCGNNSLTNIDLINNTLLQTFWCDNNGISSLDVSLQTALTSFVANDNTLTSLNLQNGNNTNITNFVAINNPGLTCIAVDDATYSTTNWAGIDATAYFSNTDCRYTAIPDANFEARLESLGYDDISADGQVPTALIEVITNLNISNQGITDITGIEDFIALTNLNVSDNTIGSLNMSNSPNLTSLSASACGLTDLDVSQNMNLFSLTADSNQLTSLNTVNNTGLESIVVYGNLITTVDFTTNTALDYIDLFQNQLTSLDLRTNTQLEILFCDNNNITNLDLSLNTELTSISCSNNELISLNVQNGNNTTITAFDAQNNNDLYCILVDDAAYSTTNWTNKDAQANFNETSCDFVIVDVDVFLQGALINPNTGEETLMRDDLRIAGAVYDGTSPYSDAASISLDVGVADNGVNSMVDWVWVELRDAGSPTTIIAGKSGVLQRDGDIVDVNDDLVTPLTFDNVPAGDYHIVVKHRNHLSIMTANATALKQVATTVNFTDATNEITYGSNAQTTFGMPSDVLAMWAGNVNGDTVVQYSGVSPDTPDILSKVLNDAGNFLNFPTYVVSGYNPDDVNLDGNTQYSGTDPDTPFILQNVLAHPGNFLNFSTYQIVEQLPENE